MIQIHENKIGNRLIKGIPYWESNQLVTGLLFGHALLVNRLRLQILSLDIVRNEYIRGSLKVTTAVEKLTQMVQTFHGKI